MINASQAKTYMITHQILEAIFNSSLSMILLRNEDPKISEFGLRLMTGKIAWNPSSPEWFAPEIQVFIRSHPESCKLLPDFCQRYWLRRERFMFVYLAVSASKLL